MNTIITSWILALMVSLAPPERLAAQPQFAGHEETAEQKLARYESIARDLEAVVFEDGRSLFPRDKERGRVKTAAIVLSVAFMESGFAEDVDVGPCYQSKSLRFARCDNAKSACMMQVLLGSGLTLSKQHGVTGLEQKDLFADRRACFRVGTFIIANSFKKCAMNGPDEKMNAYVGGTCGPRGFLPGRERLRLARRLLDRGPVPLDSAHSISAQTSPVVQAREVLSAR